VVGKRDHRLRRSSHVRIVAEFEPSSITNKKSSAGLRSNSRRRGRSNSMMPLFIDEPIFSFYHARFTGPREDLGPFKNRLHLAGRPQMAGRHTTKENSTPGSLRNKLEAF
jgi:hypothetical protein